ncbi:MAG TPA: fatty acid desaturase [Gemmatimonadales bacterium]|nr:fatty acid desaturase [Gemmatimonadales bacterium]
MKPPNEEFAFSRAPEPHRLRTKQLLQRHPEIRDLIGPNPTTFWWCLGIVGLQIAVAALVARQPWWIVAIAAYTIGAFADHALFVVIHETAHRLVFKRKVPNILTALLANLPQFFPGAMSFSKYHLKHHAFQGVYELDGDLPFRWEARLVGHSPVGKALWLLLFPIFQALRPWRVKEVPLWDRWTVVNLIVMVVFDAVVWVVLGPKALLYFALSLFFSIGLHPLGARWIQRHYLTEGGEQETFSYYGPLNRLAFNVGYHNEHHDFPSVPWNHLPQIRATAPEVYGKLAAHRSWTRLLFRFLFDRDVTLFSRIVRDDRNHVALDDAVKPDEDVLRGSAVTSNN